MNRSLYAIALTVLALFAAFLSAPAAGALISPPSDQLFQNDYSHLCMSPGTSTDSGAVVMQASCSGYSGPVWQATWSDSFQSYQIRNTHSQLCLSPASSSTDLNAAIVQYGCSQDPAQFWSFAPVNQLYTGSLWIQNHKSGLCTSPAGGSTAQNVTLVQYTCDSNFARHWKVFGPNMLSNANSGGYCLSIAGKSLGPNAGATSAYCDVDAPELWHFQPFGSDTSSTFYLENVNSELCLSPASSSTGLNVAVVQYSCDSSSARAWRVIVTSSSTYELQNVGSGLCLSPAGGGTGVNNPMVQYTCDNDPSRNWKFFGI